jgi:16S rRNA (cytosine967-C5)-methyltransferase
MDFQALKPSPTADPRVLARAKGPGRIRGFSLDLWAKILANPLAAEGILREGLREARALHSNERRFVADFLYGSFRHHRWLDSAFATGADPDKRLDAWIAVAEGVGGDWSLPETEVDALATAASLSPEFAAALLQSLGDDTIPFLLASDQRAPVGIRVNRRRSTVKEVVRSLAARGVEAVPIDGVPFGLNIAVKADILPLVREGLIEVQDEGSQRVTMLLDVQPGMSVLDVCAGAGGKSLQIADSVEAEIVALDPRSDALHELQQRARRAGATIRTEVGANARLPADLDGWTADRVLVDAPCTGSGTLRRHPELRLRIDGGDIAKHTALQAKILRAAAERCRGRLLYVTCSVLLDENESIVSAFLADRPDFALVGTEHFRPDTHGTDGFFAAILEKRG